MTALRNATDTVTNEDADPAQARWSQSEMLLAALIDELRVLRYVYVSAQSKKKQPPPEPYPRPGVKKRSRKLSSKAAQWLFKHINGAESTEG